MAAPPLQQSSFLLANLKADSSTKPLLQRCQELIKIIDDYPAKDLHSVLPWLVETVFGSLDGVLSGWNLRFLHSRCNECSVVIDFLKPGGPMMKLVYKLQAEGYKYEVPVNYLPGPVKACIQDGVLPECPLFHNKSPLSGALALNIALNPFEFFMFSFAHCLLTPKSVPVGHHSSSADSAYFLLVDLYLKYFLPTEGSVPPSPFTDSRGSVPAASPRSSGASFSSYSHSPSLFKHHIFHQPTAPAEPSAQEVWRTETLLQMLVEVWLHHYSLEMYQKLQSPQVKLALLQYRLMSMSSTPSPSVLLPGCGSLHAYQRSLGVPGSSVALTGREAHGVRWKVWEEPFAPTEEHVLLVRLLIKHLHAFSNSLKPEPHTHSHTHSSPLEEFKRVVMQRFVQQKLFLFLQHCFSHWPMDSSFRAVLETWLSYIQPWRYSSEKDNRQLEQKDSALERWEWFVQENLLMFTKLFQMFLSRCVRTDLVNAMNALMVFRVSKVFSQPHLADIIQKGEQLFLEPEHVLHHRTPRGHMTPSQGGSYLSSRQRLQTDAVFRVKSHVYALEGTDCTYTQMFGTEQRAAVLKLVQTIAQARHTAQRMSEHYGDMSSNSSLLSWSWFGLGTSETSGAFMGTDSEENGECLKKTHEFLDRALENLCLIFKCNQVQLTQLISSLGSCDEDVTNQQLPDSVQTEDGLILTDLGRKQVINGLRRFDLVYQGDPDLQPIRSYENAALVRLFYRISCQLNHKLEAPLSALCSRTDLLGLVSRRLLTDGRAAHPSRSPVPPGGAELSSRARLSLRPLASYRTLLMLLLLLLLYLLGAVLSPSPTYTLSLLLAAGLALRLAL